MRNVFRATTPVQLMEDIRAYHGWRWLEGESRTKRVGQIFDITVDHNRNQYVARRKPTPKG